jgi:hypothetical protein
MVILPNMSQQWAKQNANAEMVPPRNDMVFVD